MGRKLSYWRQGRLIRRCSRFLPDSHASSLCRPQTSTEFHKGWQRAINLCGEDFSTRQSGLWEQSLANCYFALVPSQNAIGANAFKISV
jgi:hypothetical protein